MDKVLAKHAAARRRHPDAGLLRLQPDGVQGARRGRSAAGDRAAPRLPDRGQAGRAGLRAGDQVRAHRGRRSRRPGGGVLLRRKVLLERYVDGRDLAVSMLDGRRGPEALPVVEAVPAGEDFYDFEARYEIGRTEFVCPARAAGCVADARARAGARRPTALLGLLRLRARGPDAGRATASCSVLEANAIPGLTETSLLPQAAEAAGMGFDAAGRADPGPALARVATALSLRRAYAARRRRSPRA